MRILFLAPQPFFQERGTPIAVRLALKVLSERKRDSIELLTFAEGQDLTIENVRINRIWSPAILRGVRPGFSLKKLACDLIFFITAFFMILRSKFNGQNFALVHAVEESVFMALVFKFIFNLPYIYDMDSSLAMQLTEKLPFLRAFRHLFEYLEASAIRNSLAVIPVCDALAVIAQNKLAAHVQVLPDISLNTEDESDSEVGGLRQSLDSNIQLRSEANLNLDDKVILYVGNLEHYQGVELLIDSFACISKNFPSWHLVIIGGAQKYIDCNQSKIEGLHLSNKIHLLGPRPVSQLSIYLKQANILASPRILGNNTPMKIYSYMHSGVAIIATNLPTHTQVLTAEMAKLVDIDSNSFAEGLADLMQNDSLRSQLASMAFEEADRKYTFPVFRKTLLAIYEQVSDRIKKI